MTEHEIQLCVGDELIDNDPRMGRRFPRVLTITAILPNGVSAIDSMGRAFRFLRKRIFTDGKPRRSGLTHVSKAARP